MSPFVLKLEDVGEANHKVSEGHSSSCASYLRAFGMWYIAWLAVDFTKYAAFTAVSEKVMH